MFSTSQLPTTPNAPNPGRRRSNAMIAKSALRSAGLVDADERMADAGAPSARDRRQARHSRPYDTASSSRPHKQVDGGGRKNLPLRMNPPTAVAIRGAAGSSSSSLVRRMQPTIPSSASRARRPNSGLVASQSPKSIEALKEFVNSRWDPATQFLNLEKLAADMILKQNNITPPDMPGAAREIAPVILKLASQLVPAVKTVSFANNNFVSTGALASLNYYLPTVENVSFAHNRLRTYRDLDALIPKGTKVSKIRELILTGNPVRENTVEDGKVQVYRRFVMLFTRINRRAGLKTSPPASQVARRFPLLVMLDMEAISKITFDVPSDFAFTPHSSASASSLPTTFPADMGPGVFAGGVNSMVEGFLARFFTLFDTSRTELASAYAPNATFSFSANTTTAPRNRLRPRPTDMPNQRNLEWTTWIEAGSRNLNRVGFLDRTAASLQTGPEEIITAMHKLPKTRHEIGEPGKFLVDSWPISGVLAGEGDQSMTLYIGVHGQLTQEPVEGVCSFDRTFLLALAPEGSASAQAGWPCTILSDQLVVRTYCTPEAWAAGPMVVGNPRNAAQQPSRNLSLAPPVITPATAPVAAPVNELLATIPEPQKSQVIEVSTRTGLNTSFAVQCLEGNAWITDRALANFEQVKTTIPAEAFIQ